MYTGSTGLNVLQAHVQRFEKTGKIPWCFFSFDKEFIIKYFGEEAAKWAEQKKHEDTIEFLEKLEEAKIIKKTLLTR